MDSELRSHIFEPFFTTKEKGKGTGLGLATVYGIVKQSGGYIWVYSEKDQGTTFKIYFPRVDTSPANGAAVPASQQAQCSRTILVVEDEESARCLITEFLLDKGFQVFQASGGDEALSLCEQHPQTIDLVLTDVVMPGTTGEDLAGYLAARVPFAKVLYMSGFPRHELATRGVLTGPENLIEKPFRLADLHNRIIKLLN
jgi:CheY-like chemotaxis protein